jgi:hypothetical protein
MAPVAAVENQIRKGAAYELLGRLVRGSDTLHTAHA